MSLKLENVFKKVYKHVYHFLRKRNGAIDYILKTKIQKDANNKAKIKKNIFEINVRQLHQNMVLRNQIKCSRESCSVVLVTWLWLGEFGENWAASWSGSFRATIRYFRSFYFS